MIQPGTVPSSSPRRRCQSSNEPAAAPSATTAARSSRSRGDLEQHVGAGREARARRSGPGRRRRCSLQERERAGDVLGPVPAVVVLAAVALAAAARVVEQDAVAVAGEHLRVGDRALAVAAAAVDDEHRGAVARRAVPAGEVEPVAGLERDVAVSGARRLADRLAPLVRRDDARARSGRARRGSASSRRRARATARDVHVPSPRCRHGIATASPTSTTPGGRGERAGHVAAGGAVLLRCGARGASPLTSASAAERERERRAQRRAAARERERRRRRPRRPRSGPRARAGRARGPGPGARTRRRARAPGPAAAARREDRRLAVRRVMAPAPRRRTRPRAARTPRGATRGRRRGRTPGISQSVAGLARGRVVAAVELLAVSALSGAAIEQHGLARSSPRGPSGSPAAPGWRTRRPTPS